MAIVGNLIRKGIILRESIEQEYISPFEMQRQELRKLLVTARDTQFGALYDFKTILKTFRSDDFFRFYEIFTKNVPVSDYDRMYNNWWHRILLGEKNVCWPGKIKFFALSSGTSGSSSKHIPITKEQIKAIRKTSVRQLLTLSKYSLPDELFSAGMLMLGGSTHLNYNGTFFEGDLSGITANHIPLWFQRFYKPGQKIAKQVDWGKKLDEITKKAHKWNIGCIVGVPSWVQILLEKIINHYALKNIHEIWPNFLIYGHGGVAFEPYKYVFEKLLGKPVHYIETYLASEGFIAFQNRPDPEGMKLVLNNGIFYEFVPFNKTNFTDNGDLADNAKTLTINEIEEGKDYAILLSTCAGAWRYQIGDTIRLANRELSEIVITGRTKHFLSICGEHTTIDNLNKAVKMLDEEMNLGIKEFTVAAVPYQNLFAHHWYVGTEKKANPLIVKQKLDLCLKQLNDDYRTEREHALKEVMVDLIPNKIFYDYLRLQGKEGGQNKFPRVIVNEKLSDWKSFIDKSVKNG
jgi:hypothetical protein